MKKIFFLGALAVTALGVQSCLDYDDPGTELGIDQTTTETTVHHGNPDSLGYRRFFTQEEEMLFRMFEDRVIRLREEIAEQIKALQGMKEMAAIYGFDISRPAKDAKEAVQWLYF